MGRLHEQIVEDASARWGAEAVRAAVAGDAIGGVVPRLVLEPADEAMLSEMLGWANTDVIAIVPRGAGTKLRYGPPPARADAVLSMARLCGPVDHRPGDLTAMVPAGASLAAVNAALSLERQWLPLDPPSTGATIGGIVAANESGPHRLQHGAPRDLILGASMVLAGGRLAKAGGQVVKNVAGYDLARLLCGSGGRLAVITSATFKLAPLAATSVTVVASADTAAQVAAMAATMAAAPLSPSAVELDAPPRRLLVRFEGTARSTAAQADTASVLLARHGAAVDRCASAAEDALWREHDARLQTAGRAVLKVVVLPAGVGDLLARMDDIAARDGADYVVSGRATLGVLLVQWPADAPAATASLRALRAAAHALGGHLTVIAWPNPLGLSTDLWDDPGSGQRVMEAVKARFDPQGILNPGRGLVATWAAT